MLSRTSNYGGFQSYADKPVPALKPGQQALERNYYNTVSNAPQDSYLATYNRSNSSYNASVSGVVRPEDYVEQRRLPVVDKMGRSNYITEPVQEEEKNLHMTSHWTTMYQQEFHAKAKSQAQRPEWSLPQPPHQVRVPPDFYWTKNKS